MVFQCQPDASAQGSAEIVPEPFVYGTMECGGALCRIYPTPKTQNLFFFSKIQKNHPTRETGKKPGNGREKARNFLALGPSFFYIFF